VTSRLFLFFPCQRFEISADGIMSTYNTSYIQACPISLTGEGELGCENNGDDQDRDVVELGPHW
jgi:hypothetical protein